MAVNCLDVLGARVCAGEMGVNTTVYRGLVFDPSMDPGGGASLVLLTHGHPDHFRAAGVLRGRGARVAAPRLCRAFVEEPELLRMATLGFWGPAPGELVTRYFHGGGVPVDLVVEPGPVAPGVEALAAPGHTPGSIVYLVEAPRGRLLVAGDTIYGYGVLQGSPLLYLNDAVSLRATLGRLRGLEVDAVVPGHGEPVEGSGEARRLIEANLGKLDEMERLVLGQLPGPLEEPVYADEVAARVAEATGYARSPRSVSILSPSVRALLAGLAARGLAEMHVVRGVPAWRKRG